MADQTFVSILESWVGKPVTVVNPESYKTTALGQGVSFQTYEAKIATIGVDFVGLAFVAKRKESTLEVEQYVAEATRQTMLTTGRAMLFTTLVLVTGFWLFMFATLINLIQFGFLIGVTLIIALLGDIFLAPAMMELITRTQCGREILLRWGNAQTA